MESQKPLAVGREQSLLAWSQKPELLKGKGKTGAHEHFNQELSKRYLPSGPVVKTAFHAGGANSIPGHFQVWLQRSFWDFDRTRV